MMQDNNKEEKNEMEIHGFLWTVMIQSFRQTAVHYRKCRGLYGFHCLETPNRTNDGDAGN